MPSKPRGPCRIQRCPYLQPCPVHSYDRSREGARARGYDSAHEAWRRQVLAREPICRDPDRRHPHIEQLSVVADHIVPLTRGGSWSLENGQGLCRSCHSAKTVKYDGGFGR